MSIEKDEILYWSDIQTLYRNLKTAREKFRISTEGVDWNPDNPGFAKPEQVEDLNDLVNAMSTNKYLKKVAVTNVVVPDQGTLIYPIEFSAIATTIDNINNTCAYDSCNCEGYTPCNDDGSDYCTHCNHDTFCPYGDPCTANVWGC